MYLHSLLDDSLSIVRFELTQLTRLLSIIDKGIRAELSDLQKEIHNLRERGIDTDDQQDASDLMATADIGRYENYTGIVMAFSVYERFLMETLNVADREIDGRSVDKEK